MTILDDLASHYAAGYPTFDPSATDRVASALPEPVLLSGPVFGAARLADLASSQAWFLSLSCAACVAAIFLALPAVFRLLRTPVRAGMGILALILVAVAVVTSFLSLALGWYAASVASRGYVLTANRIVLVEADGSRTEYPASTITSVSRSGTGVEITTARGPGLSIPPGSTDRASLDTAYETLTGAFRPNQSVRDSLVR